MNVFMHDGKCVLEGVWSVITAARSFNEALLSIPKEATHWVRYTTGTTAELVIGETIHGATTAAATATVVKVVTEQGSIGATTAAGVLFLRNRSTTAFISEIVHAAVSNGTVVIEQNPIALPVGIVHPKAALISVETASIHTTLSGLLVTVTAGTNQGTTMAAGQSRVIRGIDNIRNFQAINEVNANGAIVKYELYY